MTTTTRSARYYPGQIVVDIVNGTAYEVESHPQKNVRATTAKGETWRIPPSRLRLATAEESESFRDSKVETTFFYPGNVVRFVSALPGFWVVTKETPSGYNLVKLGGVTTGRYYRSVSPASLVKVTAEELSAEPFLNV